MIKLAVLGSTRGSLLPGIAQGINLRSLPFKLVQVISNKADAGILDKAEHLGLAYQAVVSKKGQSREEYDRSLNQVLVEYDVEYILLLGFMRILSPWLVNKWPHRIINTHPSLLPKHGGLMDLAVHQSVLDCGDIISGCTVHYVEEKVDSGAILVQNKCDVLCDDTPLVLKQRVQALEVTTILDALTRISNG